MGGIAVGLTELDRTAMKRSTNLVFCQKSLMATAGCFKSTKHALHIISASMASRGSQAHHGKSRIETSEQMLVLGALLISGPLKRGARACRVGFAVAELWTVPHFDYGYVIFRIAGLITSL